MREMFIFYALLPCVCFPFLRWVKCYSGCFRLFFFLILETKKVVASRARQVSVLYINNCMGICFGGLSVGRLRRAVIL